jgi:hypothetical protein
LKATKLNRVDFRAFVVIPIIVGICMPTSLLIPGFRRMLDSLGGTTLVITFGILGFFLVFKTGKFIYLLAGIFHRSLIKNNKDFIVLELENAKTYDKFKFVADDMGILFNGDNILYLRTSEYLYELDPRIFFAPVETSKFSGLLKGLRIKLMNQGIETEWIAKPMVKGTVPNVKEGDPILAWLHSRIDLWFDFDNKQ